MMENVITNKQSSKEMLLCTGPSGRLLLYELFALSKLCEMENLNNKMSTYLENKDFLQHWWTYLHL